MAYTHLCVAAMQPSTCVALTYANVPALYVMQFHSSLIALQDTADFSSICFLLILLIAHLFPAYCNDGLFIALIT